MLSEKVELLIVFLLHATFDGSIKINFIDDKELAVLSTGNRRIARVVREQRQLSKDDARSKRSHRLPVGCDAD